MRKHNAFTIVELLIVVVVIAILAAITIVAFNGIQQRARASSASAGAEQAKRKLIVYQVANGSYPLTGSLASAEVNNSGSTTYEYTSDGTTFCLTATSGNVSYKTSDTSGSTAGGCSGHGQNGVAAITNIVPVPKTAMFNTLVGGTTRTTNQTWNSKTYWTRFTYDGSAGAYSNNRYYVPASSLTNGTTYTASMLLGNPNASSVQVYIDFCDQPLQSIVLAAGEMRRVSVSGTRSTYDAVYRFIDLATPVATSGVLVSDLMLTSGTSVYNYADGDSTNWIWNGAQNNSSSTGPAL